jgi:hypothetical protein
MIEKRLVYIRFTSSSLDAAACLVGRKAVSSGIRFFIGIWVLFPKRLFSYVDFICV